MCLYSRLIKNKKYVPNKKNGGNVPIAKDKRVLATPIGCGFCIECKNKEAKNWQVRLLEDVRHNKNGKFITLTFSNESVKKLERKINKGRKFKILGYDLDNMIAKEAVRDFCETWRSRDRKRQKNKRGKALRHWLITELGHKGTENIHLHGIVWTDEAAEEIRNCWRFGYSWIGKKNENGKTKNYVNERTVNYVIKYVKKMDFDHKYYKPKVFTSAGIGKGYLDRLDWLKNKYKENKTDECYSTKSGHKMSMPIYWRNKIYSEDEREKLWIEKLDKNKRYILGEEIDVSINHNEYYKCLKFARKKNERLGYSGDINWVEKEYEELRRIMLTNRRINEAERKENLKIYSEPLKKENTIYKSEYNWE